MFGYITADTSLLSDEETGRYAACYCGLCRSLHERHGLRARMTLTYDMTFLVLLLSSLYEPEEDSGDARCPAHPLKPRSYFHNRFTDYAADLNLLLGWYNCLDDWEDEKKVTSKAAAALLKKGAGSVAEAYPRQAKAITECLTDLHRYETGEEVSADRAADCFGRLMGELFVYNEQDYWAPTLRKLGEGLGRFIYIMDACIDYHGDEKHHRPNPLRDLKGGERTREEDYDILTLLLSECTSAFEYLPLEQDLGLMRSILYSGVWQKYNYAFRRRDKALWEQYRSDGAEDAEIDSAQTAPEASVNESENEGGHADERPL